MSDRHRFRFFVDAAGAPGGLAQLAPVDARHARVLRLEAGDVVDAVDREGQPWEARITADGLEFVRSIEGATDSAELELYAGALTGAKFDELVDGAVQAGATLVTPLATARRDAERLGARQARLERIARSAAKQARRTIVPRIGAPIGPDELPAHGIVLDATAPETLDRIVAGAGAGPVRLLVGGAEGLDVELVERLVERGWLRARLGPTILRAELAAAVAVAVAAMHVPHPAIATADD